MIRPSYRGMTVAAGCIASGIASAAHAQICHSVIANETLTPVCPGFVRTINSFDDGSGSGTAFFAGGTLPTIGNIAKLTPTGWQRAGSGLSFAVSALEIIQDPSGPTLYAGGDGGMARWVNGDWQVLNPSPGAGVTAFVMYDDLSGTGPALHVLAGNTLRKQTAAGWSTVATISPGASDRPVERVHVIDNFDPQTHRAAIVFAASVTAGGLTGGGVLGINSGIARYDGLSVAGLPTTPYGNWIKSAVVFDDSTHGPSLYVSGHGNTTAVPTSIARFNTTSQAWEPVGANPFTLGDAAYGMAVFPSITGVTPRLLAIGGSSYMGMNPGGTIEEWDGFTWTVISRAFISVPSSMGYHLPSRAGVLGAAHVPAVLCASQPVTGGTAVFAVVGCPRCPADTNLDGHVTIDDLFLYLDAWFARRLSADLGAQGLSAQDIFDYMQAWFTPCQ